jgi:hypothetical protein
MIMNQLNAVCIFEACFGNTRNALNGNPVLTLIKPAGSKSSMS